MNGRRNAGTYFFVRSQVADILPTSWDTNRERAKMDTAMAYGSEAQIGKRQVKRVSSPPSRRNETVNDLNCNDEL